MTFLSGWVRALLNWLREPLSNSYSEQKKRRARARRQMERELW